MPGSTTEVVIVGGGPAGLTTAIALVAAGVETVLVAKAPAGVDHRTTMLLTGSATAARHSLSASKTYMVESDYVFQPRIFTELQHAQAIALPYDGLNPLPAQYCYLKPHYLDVQTSYFDHVTRGAL